MSDTNLAHTVQTVNKQHVTPVDVLSDNIYHWDAAAKELTLIAANQRRERVEFPQLTQQQIAQQDKPEQLHLRGR